MRKIKDHSKPLFAKWIILRSTFFRQHQRRWNVWLETFWNRTCVREGHSELKQYITSEYPNSTKS